MADDEKAAELSRKWCRLCEEWKAAIVFMAETVGTELVESSRELTYCPQCGATLLLEQS